MSFKFCFILSVLFSINIFGQYSDCLTSEMNVICDLDDLDGFIFTMDPPGGTVPSEPFCNGGAFHNPAFFTFATGSSDMVITLIPFQCDTVPNGDTGINVSIWEGCPDYGGTCIAGDSGCYNTPVTLSVNNFLVGNSYNLVVDGCSGSVCNVEFEIVDNTAHPGMDFITLPSDLILTCNDSNNPTLINDWLNSLGGATFVPPCQGDGIISNDYDGTPPACGSSELVTFTIEGDGTSISASANITVEGTSVEFLQSQSNEIESNTSYDICLGIIGESSVNSTIVEVSISSSSTATNGIDYQSINTIQLITFPIGSSTDECFTITLIDDNNIELDETVIFEITNVTGGDNATIGSPSTTVFTILDNDDLDGDGIENTVDNCVANFNPGQEDIDEDGIGDVCDTSNVVSQLSEIKDNIYLNKNYSGVIVKSPDGNCWIMTVTDSGVIQAISVICP